MKNLSFIIFLSTVIVKIRGCLNRHIVSDLWSYGYENGPYLRMEAISRRKPFYAWVVIMLNLSARSFYVWHLGAALNVQNLSRRLHMVWERFYLLCHPSILLLNRNDARKMDTIKAVSS